MDLYVVMLKTLFEGWSRFSLSLRKSNLCLLDDTNLKGSDRTLLYPLDDNFMRFGWY